MRFGSFYYYNIGQIVICQRLGVTNKWPKVYGVRCTVYSLRIHDLTLCTVNREPFSYNLDRLTLFWATI
jgi:hypothetical protein